MQQACLVREDQEKAGGARAWREKSIVVVGRTRLNTRQSATFQRAGCATKTWLLAETGETPSQYTWHSAQD